MRKAVIITSFLLTYTALVALTLFAVGVVAIKYLEATT